MTYSGEAAGASKCTAPCTSARCAHVLIGWRPCHMSLVACRMLFVKGHMHVSVLYSQVAKQGTCLLGCITLKLLALLRGLWQHGARTRAVALGGRLADALIAPALAAIDGACSTKRQDETMLLTV